MQRREFLSDDVLRAELKQALQHSPESRFTHRLNCVLLVDKGHSCYELAHYFGESPRTLERWMCQFRKFGVAGLKDRRRPGRPKVLDADQLDKLRQDVAYSPAKFSYSELLWTGDLLARHLQSRYGVMLGVRQCQRLLKQLKVAVK